MTRPYRAQPNKTEQIARFLLSKGRGMTAKEVYANGFRFSDGVETTSDAISVLMNKLHCSARYVVERSYIVEGRHRMVEVKVLSIADSLYGEDGPNAEIKLSHGQMWRRLLARKNGESLRP